MRRTRSLHPASEVAGPGAAGALIKLVGAPMALLVDAVLLGIVSAGILRGIQRAAKAPSLARRRASGRHARGLRLRGAPSAAGRDGLHCRRMADVSPRRACRADPVRNAHPRIVRAGAVGLSYVGLGIGTIVASMLGNRDQPPLRTGASTGAGRGGVRSRLAARRSCACVHRRRRHVRRDADDVSASARC